MFHSCTLCSCRPTIVNVRYVVFLLQRFTNNRTRRTYHLFIFIYYVIFTQEYPITAQHCSPWGSCNGRHETYVTSKYHSVNVLVSRSSLCVLLKKYMLLTHDRVCLFTADKCKTLLDVSYFEIVLYFCFNSFPVYAICLEIETNVSTDRAILKILRHHIENDVFTT